MKRIYGIVYKTTFPNGKIYIGQTVRINDNYFGSGIQADRAIKKFGIKNLKRETLRKCKSKKELNNWEKIYIIKFNSTDLSIGYNIDKGGFGNGRLSEQTKIKIKKSLIGKKFPDERIDKAVKNRQGYKHTEETISKIKNSNLGVKRNSKSKSNISRAQNKRFLKNPISDETKRKMKISQEKRRKREKEIAKSRLI